MLAFLKIRLKLYILTGKNKVKLNLICQTYKTKSGIACRMPFMKMEMYQQTLVIFLDIIAIAFVIVLPILRLYAKISL